MNWATHTISLSNRDGQFHCNEQQSLLHGVESQRIKAVQAGCRGGGCGVCKSTRAQRRVQQQENEQKACVS